MVLGAKVTTDIKHLLALIKGNLGLGIINKVVSFACSDVFD